MTCIHISQAQDKVNELIGKMNNSNSSLHERLGNYIKEDEVDALLAKLRTTYTARTINKIRNDDLYNHLSVIFDIITIAKENIEATKEGLLERGISNSKVRKFGKKCKKVAQLEVWIEKIKEQYEERQEVPLYKDV
jgi:phosphopantetheine adenylyltransferase